MSILVLKGITLATSTPFIEPLGFKFTFVCLGNSFFSHSTDLFSNSGLFSEHPILTV